MKLFSLFSFSLLLSTFFLHAQTIPSPPPIEGAITPQTPSVNPPPSDAHIGPFHSSFELYEKARTLKETSQRHERDALLKTFTEKVKQLLKLYPQHQDALKARYRSGTAFSLIGEHKKSNEIFFQIVHRERVGHLVAASAFRLGINHYNQQDWPQALFYFDIAWRQSEKIKMTHDALHRKIQCLSKLNRANETLATLEALINEPNIEETLRLEAKEAHKKLLSTTPQSF